MKVLWLVNGVMPEYARLAGRAESPYGGWLDGSAEYLSRIPEIELAIIIPDRALAAVTGPCQGKRITYYPIPDVSTWNLNKARSLFSDILQYARPDLVDIHGTENFHAFALAVTCAQSGTPFAVTIQGIVGAISAHMNTGLPPRVVRDHTLRDLVRGNLTGDLARRFERMGETERRTLRLAPNIIGRTAFDRAYTSQVNPSARYYHCDESLRDVFYGPTWELSGCERRTIFLSQANYPIKGAHLALAALAILAEEFPDVRMFVAGKDITRTRRITDRLRLTNYGRHLRKLRAGLGLSDRVGFIGEVGATEMIRWYLSCNVFVCPSTIENSPNSLGEALVLGVPSVASYVGGVPDFVEHEANGLLYQADAPYMLAYQISRIFREDELAVSLSREARARSAFVYDRSKNAEELARVYETILVRRRSR